MAWHRPEVDAVGMAGPQNLRRSPDLEEVVAELVPFHTERPEKPLDELCFRWRLGRTAVGQHQRDAFEVSHSCAFC